MVKDTAPATTTARIYMDTKERLRKIGSRGMTDDEAINLLIDTTKPSNVSGWRWPETARGPVTAIEIKMPTKERLRKIGVRGMSDDSVLNWMIDKYEKKK